MNAYKQLLLRIFDVMLAPFVAMATIPMRLARWKKTSSLPITFAIFRRMGVFPIKAHYYEPQFDCVGLDKDNPPRNLPGIAFAMDRQMALLSQFKDVARLDAVLARPGAGNGFRMENPNFGTGDAEIWFHVIRHFRPARIVEIGSGYSTLMAKLALDTLRADDPAYRCDHVCIEPYEMPWLEETGVRVIRSRFEDCDLPDIRALAPNDILFIDSSHMIRSGGDVLREILEVLPGLAPGVVVHFHDIFSPRDYPVKWRLEPRFWNEQYLLEAFLSHNSAFEILLAVNMLKHAQFDALKAVCPRLAEEREPGSFYLRRVR